MRRITTKRGPLKVTGNTNQNTAQMSPQLNETQAVTNDGSNTRVGRISGLIPVQAPSTAPPPTHRWSTQALRPRTAQPDRTINRHNSIFLSLTPKRLFPIKFSPQQCYV